MSGQTSYFSLAFKTASPAELIKSPVAAKIKDCSQVSCGVDFTVWLCKGQLYSAGNPQHGQLGHGTDHEYNAKECECTFLRTDETKFPRDRAVWMSYMLLDAPIAGRH